MLGAPLQREPGQRMGSPVGLNLAKFLRSSCKFFEAFVFAVNPNIFVPPRFAFDTQSLADQATARVTGVTDACGVRWTYDIGPPCAESAPG